MFYRLVGFLIELVSSARIVLSPFLFGVFIGGIIYYFKQDKSGLVMGGLVAGIGLVLGVLWAVKVKKKMLATDFMSRVNASPDLDKIDEKK